ncbi:hypothetical protein NA8A_04150 [Nitratireductor indicus C115]|uniref:Tip attachment protein J domain-containing protein n=1 Tax=Nitratireductor indicus C115 TaxID=1231190 RepID=K2PSC1_9HYPH|nr:phage tail protein [Nitratireductor indicus]EKF43972.1 hypothetical protein NA8A_04150 [Nitratireductor indicus C115]SFQ13038.1 Putative phage tail protein [Nitratireductor indicus]
MIGIFFWTAWFLLAGTAYAHAGPLAGLIGLLTSTTIGKLVLGVALKLGMSLLQSVLMKQDEPQQSGIRTKISVGGVKSMSFLVGTYATAGHLVYANTWGAVRKTSNAGLAQVIGLSDLPVTSISNEVSMRGRMVTRNPALGEQAGSFSWFGPESYPFEEFTDGDHPGIYWLFAKYLPSGGVDADAKLRSVFGGDADRPWQADMIGRGVAHVILTAEFNRDLFRDLPEAIWQVEGLPLYDPRFDDTVGGSGPQRWGDFATYAFTDNPAVIIYNILRGIYYQGSLVFGGAIPASRLPLSNWFAAMNECDRLVDSERQFRCGFEIKPFDHAPLYVIEELLKACNGRMAEIGGVYKIRVGAPALPSYFFTDEAVVITENQSFDPHPGLEQTYNGVSATYPEPEAAWEMKDAPLRIDPDFVSADDGRELIAPVQFPAVPFAIQVQRLQSALMRDNRRFRKHRHTLPPEAWLLEPLDTVSWTSAHNGYVGKLFEISSMDDLENSNQAVSLKEADPGDWGWNPPTDELPWEVGPTGPITPEPQPIYDWTAEPDIVPDNTGAARRPAILLGWYGQVQDVQGVEFEVRLAVTGEVVYRGRTDQVSDGELLISQGLLPDTDYQVRARYIPFSNRRTLWSGWLLVRTRDVRFNVYSDVDLDGLRDAIDGATEWMGPGVRKLIDDARQLVASIADQGYSDYSDRQKIRRELTETRNGITAAFTEAIDVAVGPNSALAQRLEQLEVSLGDYATVTALDALTVRVTNNEGNISGLAQAITDLGVSVDEDIASAVTLLQGQINTVDGKTVANAAAITDLGVAVGDIAASVTITAEAGADPGGGWSRYMVKLIAEGADAFFYMDVNGTVSRTVFHSDEFVLTDGDETVNPIVFAGGIAKLNIAHIGEVSSGLITSPDGKIRFQLDEGRIVVSD